MGNAHIQLRYPSRRTSTVKCLLSIRRACSPVRVAKCTQSIARSQATEVHSSCLTLHSERPICRSKATFPIPERRVLLNWTAAPRKIYPPTARRQPHNRRTQVPVNIASHRKFSRSTVRCSRADLLVRRRRPRLWRSWTFLPPSAPRSALASARSAYQSTLSVAGRINRSNRAAEVRLSGVYPFYTPTLNTQTDTARRTPRRSCSSHHFSDLSSRALAISETTHYTTPSVRTIRAVI
mmetsp:Transcript_4755/g.15856  ORF Transcript_4755/g.15856 Transcript_4755/m.15856 type:complete len:237 (-) Transcript_4755:554-1264(-)